MPNQAELDLAFMAQAIELAKQGWYSTQPNPRVGAVIVAQGQVVGQGLHWQAGQAHAEINALAQAGEQARGATAYVSLEPCSHYGRTPPCALALIDAGIARLVYGMADPNPQVAGRGLAILAEAGLEIVGPLLSEQAQALNPGFCQRMLTGRPRVTLKMASSLDGRTAMASGESQWLTGPEARADVQKGRAQSGAVLSTAQTVLADQAALNVRPQTLPPLPGGRAYLQPLRVILDKTLRIDLSARLFQVPGPILLVHEQDVDSQRRQDRQQKGVECLALPYNRGFDLHALLQELGRRQVNDLWVEAGATLAGSLVDQGLVDEYWLYLAPLFLGQTARPLMASSWQLLAEVPRLRLLSQVQLGNDLRLILQEPQCSQAL